MLNGPHTDLLKFCVQQHLHQWRGQMLTSWHASCLGNFSLQRETWGREMRQECKKGRKDGNIGVRKRMRKDKKKYLRSRSTGIAQEPQICGLQPTSFFCFVFNKMIFYVIELFIIYNLFFCLLKMTSSVPLQWNAKHLQSTVHRKL